MFVSKPCIYYLKVSFILCWSLDKDTKKGWFWNIKSPLLHDTLFLDNFDFRNNPTTMVYIIFLWHSLRHSGSHPVLYCLQLMSYLDCPMSQHYYHGQNNPHFVYFASYEIENTAFNQILYVKHSIANKEDNFIFKFLIRINICVIIICCNVSIISRNCAFEDNNIFK